MEARKSTIRAAFAFDAQSQSTKLFTIFSHSNKIVVRHKKLTVKSFGQENENTDGYAVLNNSGVPTIIFLMPTGSYKNNTANKYTVCNISATMQGSKIKKGIIFTSKIKMSMIIIIKNDYVQRLQCTVNK